MARSPYPAAFGELVDEILYSHEIGVEKPDPRAFATACERLDVRAEDCLFVDDAPANVAAAARAGMQAHLCRGNPAALDRISAHLAPAPAG
ncbi:HAD-IA family hydrolase [Micromonospora sp. NPDC005222]|uniref:HAD-IA family hydrolase n=1 Tax=unclassified Micromonospora TaxID=2617518 RepID=UPI0033A26062